MSSSDPNQEKDLHLTRGTAIFLLVFYLLAFLLGLTFVLGVLLNNSILPGDTFQRSLVGSIGASAAGGSIFYIRKLYKSCFRQGIGTSPAEDLFFKQFATFAYFFSRPIYSIIFGVFVVLGLKAGLIILASSTPPSNEGFLYTSMFLSFYVGFFPGKFLTKLENGADNAIERILSGKG